MINSIEKVFNCEDIIEYIMNKMEYYDISNIGLINKLFNKVSKRIYDIKIRIQLYDPFANEYNYYTTLLIHTRDNPITIYNYQYYVTIFYDFIERIVETYWVVLIKDLNKMEHIFESLIYYNNTYDIYTYRLQGYHIDINIEQKKLKNRMDKTNKKIFKYLYVENPDKYNVSELKSMAKFKKIKKYYRLRRSHLVKKLSRPENAIYYLEDN